MKGKKKSEQRKKMLIVKRKFIFSLPKLDFATFKKRD